MICGAISQYNATGPMRGPSNYMSLLVNQASHDRLRRVRLRRPLRGGGARRWPAGWPTGKLKTREDVVEGLETLPETPAGALRGENLGKQVLKVG